MNLLLAPSGARVILVESGEIAIVALVQRLILHHGDAGRSHLLERQRQCVLRALVMVLERLTPQSILAREIATGVPIIYRLNDDATVASKLDLAA